MIERIFIKIGIIIFVFIIVESISFKIVPYNSVSNSEYGYRNPFYKRGWPEYIDDTIETSKNKKRIIVISNSQGFGRETSDKHIYSAELQKLLSSNDFDDYAVLNWSVAGPIHSDLLILFAKAIDINPEIIILNTFPINFTSKTWRGINHSAQDLDLLISDTSVNSNLDGEWKNEYVDNQFLVYSWFVLKSNFLRLRFFINDSFNRKKKEIPFQLATPTAGFNSKIKKNKKIRSIKIRAHKKDFVTELYKTYDLSKNDQTIVFINEMPLNNSKFLHRNVSRKNINFFYKTLRSFSNKRAMVHSKNYSNALLNNHFYTATHFDFHNHKLFAEIIFEDLTSHLKR